MVLPKGYNTFHSHPSGIGVNCSRYVQSPSNTDIAAIGQTYQYNSNGFITGVTTHTGYVFGKGNGTVYIYNSSGVQATLPISKFVKFKE